MKFNIDISTEEKRKEIYELFNSFTKKSSIFEYYGISDNGANINKINEIAQDIGFDFGKYKKRKEKEQGFCLECGKPLEKGQKKFCCISCSAKYNNRQRGEHCVTEETKEKIRNSLKKYYKEQGKEDKIFYCSKCGRQIISKKEIKGKILCNFCKKKEEEARLKLLNSIKCEVEANNSKSKIFSVNEETLREIIKYSITYKDVLRKLGFHEMGGAPWNYLKKRIEELNIDISHFKGRAHGTSNTRKKDDGEIYVEHSTYLNKGSLKKRLIKDNIKECKCEKCGRTEWEGLPIPLQLHHINGINDDNRIENLQLLCPNCHAQTDTYCGKNIYKHEKAKTI